MTTLTCGFVDDPPRVTLDVTDMPAGTATVEMVRLSESGAQAPVRGADTVRVQDTRAWTTTDWEAPLGRACTWRATFRNSAGGLLSTVDGTLTEPEKIGPELIVNGGSENGTTAWDLSGSPAWVTSIDNPHSGTTCFMGPLKAGSTMAQTVTATTATLRLSLWTRWQSDSTATLTVTSDGTSQDAPLARGASRVWTQTAADITVTPGPVTLTLTATSAQRFFVDDVSARSVTVSTVELLTNGGFENYLAGWGKTGDGWAATVNGSGVHSGQGRALASAAGTLGQTVPATGGQPLHLDLWTWSEYAGSTVAVTPDVGDPVTMDIPVTETWQEITATVQMPAAATQATITLSAVDGGGVFCRVDDVSLTQTVAAVPVPVPPPADPDTAWISNPYDPSSAMLVTLMAGTDDDTSHDMEVSLSLPGRRTHLPSAVVGVRGLGGKRELHIRCWALDQAQQFENLLASSVTLLVRSAVIRHRTGCLYVVAGEVTEHREWEFLDGQQETTWTLAVDEVDPGALGILVPPWTWQKARAYIVAQTGKADPTWADAAAVWPLWLDATKGV